MRKVDLLRQLQETDTRIESTRTTIARLKSEIGDRHTLDLRETEFKRAQEEVRTLDAQQRDLELQAESRRAKILSDERKLYSGRVTNPKELASLSDEVAQERRQLSALEDRLLDILVRADEMGRQLAAIEATLAQETSAWNMAQQAARARLDEAQSALVSFESRRVEALAQLTPVDGSAYESLRRQKGGIAVAPVQQRTCQVCRVSLTPAQEQRARIGTDLVPCHSCGRILYVPLS